MIRELKNSFAALVCGLAFTACASNDAMATPTGADMMVINQGCPLMPEHAVDPDVTVEYMGHKVGFCCEKCVGKWEAWTEEQKTAFVKNSMK
ncbi:MAG: hypothetical protein KDE27_28950 [Planctomycetes bacterium]|nr:hypothetical protein [Planctomycetota bacterium]